MIVDYVYKANGSSERHSIKIVKSEGDEPKNSVPDWAFYCVKSSAKRYDKDQRSGRYQVVRVSKKTVKVRRFNPPTQRRRELPI